MKQQLWKYLGYLFMGIGILGIILPGLPTTPFVLLASACFMRGDPELHKKLLAHPKLGPFLKDWEAGKGIPFKAKVLAISMLWFFLLLSILFFIPITGVKILLGLIGVSVSIYLIRLPTVKN